MGCVILPRPLFQRRLCEIEIYWGVTNGWFDSVGTLVQFLVPVFPAVPLVSLTLQNRITLAVGNQR